jgi:serralysin
METTVPTTISGAIPGYFDAALTPWITNNSVDTYASILSYNGDSDWWRFTAVAGLTYDFLMTGDGGPNSLDDGRISILSSTGTVISSTTSKTAYVSFTAGTSGTYYVAVSDSYTPDGLAEGNYVITARTNDTVVNNATTTSWITPNGNTAGQLGQSGDSDWFKVNLVAGRTYDFRMSGDGSLNGLDDGELVIRGTNGAVITYTSTNGRWIGLTAATTGTYFIEIADGYAYDSAAEGNYLISSRMRDTVVANNTTTATITGTGTTSGALEARDDADWFKVTLREGLTYGFTLTGDGGANSLGRGEIAILSAGGSPLSYRSATSADPGTAALLAQTTGTYFIQVADDSLYNYDAEGNYRIRAAMSDFVRNDAATTASIRDGERIGGRVDVWLDKDWYAMAVVAGRTYTVNLTGNGATDDLIMKNLKVLSSSGQLIRSDADYSDTGTATVTFTATSSGRVYLSAEGSSYYSSNTRSAGGFHLQVISDAAVVNGTEAANHLTGGAGNTTINGNGGNDLIYGGAGDDALFGGPAMTGWTGARATTGSSAGPAMTPSLAAPGSTLPITAAPKR